MRSPPPVPAQVACARTMRVSGLHAFHSRRHPIRFGASRPGILGRSPPRGPASKMSPLGQASAAQRPVHLIVNSAGQRRVSL